MNIKTLKLHITILFSIIGFCLVAQESVVRFEKKDSTILYFLEGFATQNNLQLSYSEDAVNLSDKVQLSGFELTGDSCLSELSRKSDLKFTLVGKHLVVLPKEKLQMPSAENKNDGFRIDGYIKDSLTNEVLIGASVYFPELFWGSATNEFGYFSSVIPRGKWKVILQYIGYSKKHMEISVEDNVSIQFVMSPNVNKLEEVVIEASKYNDPRESVETGKHIVTAKNLKEIPKYMGEIDLIKSLQNIPGINSQGDGSVFFNVRGSSKDQNLILIDDAPIYNASHLLGFFSTFSSDAIKDVKIYKGDVPVQYGGMLASVIDIRTKDGNMNKFGVTGNLGPVAGMLSVEGPIIKEKVSFYLSGRRSHLQYLFPGMFANGLGLNFYDINGKINWIIGKKDRIYLSAYSGEDFMGNRISNGNSFGLQWGNQTGTFRWNHVYNQKLFSNLTYYISDYNYALIPDINQSLQWNEEIFNQSLSADFTWYKNKNNTLRFGANVKTHYFNPGNFFLDDTLAVIGLPVVSQTYGNQGVIYLSNENTPSEKIKLRYGMRMNYWANSGPNTYYTLSEKYETEDTINIDEGVFFNPIFLPEPRIGISYYPDSSSSIKLSYGRNVQFIQLLSNSVSPFTSLEVWLPTSPNIKPQINDQFTLGYYQTFSKQKAELTLETYYKDLKNQIDYVDHANMLLNPLIESQIRQGKGWAYGFETGIRKEFGRWVGWVNYHLSRTRRLIPGINNNREYSPVFDRPHEISLFATYKLNERINLSANWIYSSGMRFTSPVGFYDYLGWTIPVIDEKNNDRLPDYHRLDVSASIDLRKKKNTRFNHELGLSVYNVYSRNNPFTINFNKALNENGYVVPTDHYGNYNRVITSLSVSGIIPSFNYKFSF